MSNSTPPVVDPFPISPHRPDPNIHDPSDLPAAVDPLLQNGSFIDASIVHDNVNNNISNQAQQPNGVEPQPEVTPLKSRRKVPVVMAATDSTNWLPPGWLVEDRVRTSGATAGTVDKYYIDPVSGRRFRSKKEVQYYLETGTLKKKKRDEGDVNSTEGSSSKKSKKGSKNAKIHEWNFDYLNVPDRIEWALTDAIKDAWTPFIGGEKVTEYDRQNWDFEMMHLRH